MKNTIVLSESQRGILQIALEIARDKFATNVRTLRRAEVNPGDGITITRLWQQFEKQEEEAETLLSLVASAHDITLTEEIE